MTKEKPKAKKRKSHGRGLAAFAVCLLILALAGGAIYWAINWFDTASDPYGGKMLQGVSIAGVDVSGMSKREAASAVKACFNAVQKNGMTVSFGQADIVLNANMTVDTDALVNEAYAFGRTAFSEHGERPSVDARTAITIDEPYIRSVVTDYAEKLAGEYRPTEITLQGTMPSLDENVCNEDTSLPALQITAGASGSVLDIDAACERIIDAYAGGNTRISAEDLVAEKHPDDLDWDGISTQYCAEPRDAALNPDTKKVTPGAYGVAFDREQAEKLLSAAEPGEVISLPLSLVKPAVIGDEVYFRDVLGFCQTPHSDNELRNVNLRLACAALNGVVLQPGDTLSYNETLGKRTEANGYQPAPAYSGTELVNTLGGGICQVSSTLYLCSLYAELETVSRVSHGFPANYIPIGLDATVSWGSPDLKIRNSSDLPVKIVAEERDDFVRIWIMGTETRDYYVRMGFSSSDDGYAKSYVCKYDNETKEQISKTDCHLSSYLGGSFSMRGEIGPNEIYTNGNIKEQAVADPTPETLEASRSHSAPNQHPD